MSQQFQELVAHWKKVGYPSIESDVEKAFQSIRKDLIACHARRVPRFSEILGDLHLYKYRIKNGAAREGASGGWRIYALHDLSKGNLYPIIIYPKKEWQDASNDLVRDAIKEITDALTGTLFG